jgi:hypothetical protein
LLRRCFDAVGRSMLIEWAVMATDAVVAVLLAD